MVFIHGGSFQGDSGSTEVYGPERLLDYEIVRMFYTNTHTHSINFIFGTSLLFTDF